MDSGRWRGSSPSKGVELNLFILLAGVQGIEVGDAVDAEHQRLAVDHELPDAVLARRLHDPRITVGQKSKALNMRPRGRILELRHHFT
jgi:hypothetical protein